MDGSACTGVDVRLINRVRPGSAGGLSLLKQGKPIPTKKLVKAGPERRLGDAGRGCRAVQKHARQQQPEFPSSSVISAEWV